MAKRKIQYVCNDCGADFPKWQGQCTDCGAWNTLSEVVVASGRSAANRLGYAGEQSQLQVLHEVSLAEVPRITTGMQELDRVLGGGLVPGSVILLGGDPGIGKSSILLQVLAMMSQHQPVLYVTGEESAEQVALRAHRMGLPADKMQLFTQTDVERISQVAREVKPSVMVVDSIQTMLMADISGAPGGVSQVRECAAVLTRLAKQTNTAILLVGHVTKSGEVAGPRVLEHIVDAVVYLEGERDGRYRLMRALKNRFGAINELGVFAMTDKGMKEVTKPSAIFLSREGTAQSGSVVMIVWEGSRPLLVEVQALVDDNQYGQPRRVTVGFDNQRLVMLLAVLNRHAGVQVGKQDVFVNVVGGVKVTETSADLAIIMAILSSLKNKPVPADLIAFGEVGLSGEVRPISNGVERMTEAAKHGFHHAIVPKANAPKQSPARMKVYPVSHVQDILRLLRELS